MDINSVPQDDSSTHSEIKKAVYASDENGKIKNIASSGWNVEETVTRLAIDDLKESSKEAYKLVKDEKMSPLYYHMYNVRMDLVVLAQSTGFFQWTIKRDFKPDVFKKINQKRLLIYADALGKTTDELKILPKVEDE